jgi:hypothetical protein
MTSTIKVNTIQNTCGADIIKESSNTITIGASGDTVTLASGASQSGFGRSGSVDWQTGSIKTGNFTAADGEGYFIDTSSGAVTVSLPAGSAGAIVAFADYTRTFNSNNVTISPNGSNKIGGVAQDATLDVNGQSATFVFVDATEGWINVQETETSQTGVVPFITATGGTITTCGNFKIHTFTGPGSFVVCNVSTTPAENTVGYQVVAGGGGGGTCAGGGGGAGGFREGRNAPVDNFTASPLVANAPTNAVTITQTTFPITVGAGGTGGSGSTGANPGSNSVFSTITSAGGGAAGSRGGSPTKVGANGGSGGGTAADGPGSRPSGNTPPVTPSQGFGGGINPNPGTFNSGGNGGGGASENGNDDANPEPANAGAPDGGDGVSSSITGSSVARGGGGGGGGYAPQPNEGGCGGAGGGGRGANSCLSAPGSFAITGTVNTGGGGGGGNNSFPNCNGKGAAGGSGIVIIRYKFQ